MLVKRIEPTIGTLDLASDPAADAEARARSKGLRVRRELAHLSLTLLLLAGVVALCYASALHAGIVPEQFRPGSPNLLARTLIVVGFATLFGAQLVGSLVLFRYGFLRATLSVIVPGYLVFALIRSGIYWQVMGPWCASLGLIVVGTVMLA